MSTMIPIIWVVEIEFLNERIQTNQSNNTSSTPVPGVGSFHNKLQRPTLIIATKLLLHC